MTRRQQAFEYFLRQGWTAQQSAGLVANLEAESGLRHDAVGDGGQAYGLAQWHPPRQANFDGLFGHPIRKGTFEEQLAFVHAELMRWEKSAGDHLAACTTAGSAAAAVCRYYERPADIPGDSQNRALLAERILAECASGVPQPQPAEPIQPAQPTPTPSSGGFMPLLAALLPSILGLFAPRVQNAITKVTGQPADVSNAFLTDLFAKIQEATGQADPIRATAALQSAPAATVQEVENHALDYADKLAPVMERLHQQSKDEWSAEESSRDSAAARAIQQQMQDGGPFKNPTFIIAIFILALVAVVVGAVLFKGGFSTDMQAFVIGAIVGSALTAVISFYFGSSRNSAAKDFTIGAIAQSKGTGTGTGSGR